MALRWPPLFGVLYAAMLWSCGASQIDLSPRPKLDAPQGLSARASDLDIALSWNPVAGATHYVVYWDRESTVSPATGTPALSTETHYLHSGLVNGATYAYLVVAVDGDGYEGRPSLVVTATPSLARMEAPQHVTAVAGDAMVTLTWDAVTGATEYRVYATVRAPDGSTWNTQGVTAHNSFVDRPLQNYATYRYQIEARFGSRLGALSASVSAIPLPTKPGIPAFTHVEAGLDQERRGRMILKWAPTVHAKTYVVYAKQPGETTETPITGDQPLRTPEFHHEPIDFDVEYTYRVEAFNDGASDGPSEPVTAQAPRPRVISDRDHYLIRGEDTALQWDRVATASFVGDTTDVQVTWVPPTGIPDVRQQVYHATTSTGPHRLIATLLDPTITEYRDMGFPTQAAPTGLTAVVSGSDVTVRWNPLDQARYHLYWWERNADGETVAIGATTVPSTQYTHSPFLAGISGAVYTYAVQVDGASSVSPEVSLTVP